MSYCLYCDLGNSSLHLGLWSGRWLLDRRVSADVVSDEERVVESLVEALTDAGVVEQPCTSALLCASSPLVDQVERAICSALAISPRLVGRDVAVDMPVCYEDPSRIGRDRMVGAFAAQRLVGPPCVVLDAGTCLTCDAVAADGTLLPVAIAPGLPAMARGIGSSAPHLSEALSACLAAPLADLRGPARTTEQSLARGLTHSLIGSAVRLSAAGRNLPGVGEGAPVVVTGGDAALIVPHISGPVRPESLLVLEGLRFLDGVG